MIKLVREKKVLCLFLAYAYVFGVNFYMGYMTGLSSFFFFVFYFLYDCRKRSVKENIKILCLYAGSVLNALLLTAVIWFPAVLQLFQNIDEGYPGFSLVECNPLLIINNMFMGQMQTLFGITPFVYCGLLSMLLLPLFFLNKRISRKKRVYAFLCLVWFFCLFLI
jgi:uncharacterized membrane protein YfhO